MKKKAAVSAERAHVFYTGRVQGVGFRHTAEQKALELGLTGWVKNLRDSRVELVCEGPKTGIEELLAQIKDGQMGKYVQKTVVTWEKATGEFDDFIVEFEL